MLRGVSSHGFLKVDRKHVSEEYMAFAKYQYVLWYVWHLQSTEIPTMICPSANINYPSATGSIIVGISVSICAYVSSRQHASEECMAFANYQYVLWYVWCLSTSLVCMPDFGAFMIYIHTCMFTYIRREPYIYIYIYTHTNTHIQTYIHTYIHTHTHT